MTTGMGIAHGIFSQPRHLIPSWPPNLAKNGQFVGFSGPNYLCAWLQNASEAFQSVKMSSQTLIIKPGMGIAHAILSQPQHFLPTWPPVLAKNKQLQGWFGPNNMYVWLQTAAEVFQSQNWFTNVDYYKAWDGNCTCHFKPTITFSAKLTSHFCLKNKKLLGWFGQNCMYAWLQTDVKAHQNQHCFKRKVYKAWDGNRPQFFHPNTSFTAELTPKFIQSSTIIGLLWPK